MNRGMDGPDLNNAPIERVGSSDEQPSAMSLSGVMSGDAMPEADDLAFVDEPKRASKSTTEGILLVVLLVAVGGAALWVMRMSTGNISDSAVTREVEAKIEQTLAKMSRPELLHPTDPLKAENMRSLFADTEAVVAIFNEDPADKQVPLTLVKKNPFDVSIIKPKPVEPEVAAVMDTPEDPDRAARERRLRLAAEVSRLRLQSVVGGRMPVAVINDQLFRVGQTVNGFEITRIHDMAVRLTAEGETFQLKMDDGSSTNRRGR